MAKKINYNYAFIFYDVGEQKREYKKYLKFVKSIFHISRNLFSGGR